MGTSQSRSWMVTLPHVYYDQAAVEAGLESYTWVGQLEAGEQDGYEHWQILVENRSPIRFSTLRRKFPKGHFEPRRGTVAEAVAYVTKDETRVGPQVGRGEIDVSASSSQGKRTDLETYASMLRAGASVDDVLLAFPNAARFRSALKELEKVYLKEFAYSGRRRVESYFLHGPPGVGKTTFVFDRCGRENVFRVSNYKNPFDNYAGQKVLFLDEFRAGSLGPGLLLDVLWHDPLLLPARYADSYAVYTEVWVVSNSTPRQALMPEEFTYAWGADEQERSHQYWRAVTRRFRNFFVMDSPGQVKAKSPFLAPSDREIWVANRLRAGDLREDLPAWASSVSVGPGSGVTVDQALRDIRAVMLADDFDGSVA